MAPARKSRSWNKRFSNINKVSPTEDGESANGISPRQKRKFSDTLGPQWSNEELTCFYEAYRKHDKDWKKVAAAVRNRTIDMVEALYTMNRAYLSLPEGTASLVGLIAMMTDYYCNLAGSDSDQESNDGAGTSKKPRKRARGKVQPSSSKASEGNFSSPTQNVAPANGCLSLLMKYSGEFRPYAVGKRTPRFPVSHSHNINSNRYLSPTRQALKMKGHANDNEVAHEIAIALAEASHRVDSPHSSRTPNRLKIESGMSSPVRKPERKYSDLETTRSKPANCDLDGEDLEGSMEAGTGELSRYKAYQMECRRDSNQFRRGKKYTGKRLGVDESIQMDEIKEACSGTEESQRSGVGRLQFELEVRDVKISTSSSQVSRKRSSKVLFSEDEQSVVDALQELAGYPMRRLGPEKTDSMMQVKDEVDESGSQEAIPKSHLRHRRKYPAAKAEASQAISRFEVASPKTLKLEKVSVLRDSAVQGKMESSQSTIKAVRKKSKAVASKVQKNEDHFDINQRELQEIEFSCTIAGKKSINKTKRSSQSTSPTSAKNHEDPSSDDPRREESDSAQSVKVSVVDHVNLPTKIRSRRKTDMKKQKMLKDLKFPEKAFRDQANGPLSSFHDRVSSLKPTLSSCLSNYPARRWCICEWFYSAVDLPWFAKREFVEYLNHVGLGHAPRLTRVEWGVIRSSLGKPRRFSEQFLKEEKEKLNQYRECVRTHYAELREGVREGLPTDLARPLSVGQRVIAIHPKTREVHDGSVLTVDRSRCRIQFDRPELGVEFVLDIDCMPLNTFENMPTSLARRTIAVDNFFENLNELNLNWKVKDFVKCPPGDALENVYGFHCLSPSAYGTDVLKQTEVAAADANIQARLGSKEAATYQQTSYSQPGTLSQVRAREADIQVLADLTRALDKKEAVVMELRCMNDDVIGNQKGGNSSLKESEPFKKQYAAVLVQLREANEQVSSALNCLRQRNTYQGHSPLTGPRLKANFIDPAGLMNSFAVSVCQPQESGLHVNEIVESSKTKARTIVDAAVQAMSTLKVSGNTVQKIEEAIDYVNDRLPLDDSSMPSVSDSTVNKTSEWKESEIPSDLISQCLASLVMIQKCTERQSPPADVAQILDSAVTGLQPRCTQNLPIYSEIQKCMGIIRNQILALVPT